MNRIPLALSTFALTFAALGSAQAAPHFSTHRSAHPHAVPASMRLHERVVEARAEQQRRWITAEARQHRLDAEQALSLRQAVAKIERDQLALRRQGHESVAQALATSHRQDILDWSIRSAHVDFEPQRIAALDATA